MEALHEVGTKFCFVEVDRKRFLGPCYNRSDKHSWCKHETDKEKAAGTHWNALLTGKECLKQVSYQIVQKQRTSSNNHYNERGLMKSRGNICLSPKWNGIFFDASLRRTVIQWCNSKHTIRRHPCIYPIGSLWATRSYTRNQMHASTMRLHGFWQLCQLFLNFFLYPFNFHVQLWDHINIIYRSIINSISYDHHVTVSGHDIAWQQLREGHSHASSLSRSLGSFFTVHQGHTH